MISLPAGTHVWLASGVTDMRRGMYRLAALVETTLTANPYGMCSSSAAGGVI
jgi:transposase